MAALMTPTLTELHQGDYSVEHFRKSRARAVLKMIRKRPHSQQRAFAKAWYNKMAKKWGKEEVEQLKNDIRAALASDVR